MARRAVRRAVARAAVSESFRGRPRERSERGRPPRLYPSSRHGGPTSANHGISVRFFPSLRPLYIKRGCGHPKIFFALTREQLVVHIPAFRYLQAPFIHRWHEPKHVDSSVSRKYSGFNENLDFDRRLRRKYNSYGIRRCIFLIREAHR